MRNRRRWSVLALATALFGGTLMGAEVASAASLAVPSTPDGVVVTAGTGSVTVHWSPARKGVDYTVTSRPRGHTCHVVRTTSCVIALTTAQPVTFRVAASNAAGRSPRSPWSAALPTRRVFIVAGQSNALGVESLAVDPTSGASVFTGPSASPTDQASTIDWTDWYLVPNQARGPVRLSSPQLTRKNVFFAPNPQEQIYGPELGLARQLWTDGYGPITVVKAGVPSTLGGNWLPSSPPDVLYQQTTTLYTQLVTLTRSTMAKVAKSGALPVLSGIVWMHGESDINDTTSATDYGTNLVTLISHLRTDLPMSPTAPFVIGKVYLNPWIDGLRTSQTCDVALGCDGMVRNAAAVRAGEDWAASHLAGVVTVDTAPLGRTGSMMHLSGTGQLALGALAAGAVEPLLP